MAEAAVGAIIEVMIGKLLTLAEEQISLVRHFKDDLETLQKSFSMVQAFLHDAGEKKVTSRAVKVWLRELEDLSFDADNVIDEIDYELLSKKVKKPTDNKTAVKKKVQSLFPCCSPISHRLEIGSRIKVINEKLKKINQDATTFGLESRLAREQDILDAYGGRETDEFSVDPIFFGRENEVSEIVKMLITTTPAEQKSSVLPIVGMGGQGKTTFAKKVFHDERIISHFGDKNRVWVYVSQNFDVRNILKNILTSIMTAEKFELETQRDILKKLELGTQRDILQMLQEHLGAKKYFLVLDDVWNNNKEVWEGFVNSLSGISSDNGYCMIVTTRSEEVASNVKTFPVNKLKGLPKDDCWSIIKAKAFRGGEIPFDVEEIGKNIAKKCQGLPLAAKVVGGLLSSMKSKDEWSLVEESWLGDENPISNVLKLSYDHLPSPSLKKCFAYCSIFPKGHEIEKEKLVELWMAEGFLQTNHQKGNNNMDMETTGSKNLNILLHNSLLQHVRSDNYGNVTHCNMHDLVHDLTCSILGEGVCKSRYIGYKPSGDGFLSIPKGQERYVRTLFYGGKVSDIKFSDFESLHTLTLVSEDTDNLPISVRKLKHLRYLDISETRIGCLPDSIGELYHLQTLRAKKKNTWEKSHLEKLPDSFNCLISLRHLHISGGTTLPPEIGKLTCLQTLPYFEVGVGKGFGISELGNLEDLKGELEIRNLGNVSDRNEAMSANLLQGPGIYKLKLVWGEWRHEADEESVLEGLQPHPNLRSLNICGFKGKRLPLLTSKMAVQLDGHYSWEGLKNLMDITLQRCSECEELPMLGHLPKLQSLHLSGFTNVKSIGPSFYGIDNCENDISHNGVCTINNVVLFPALKRLVLWNMPNLKEWDDVQPSDEVVVVFPCLQYLEIWGCNQLTMAPSHHFPCLEELRIGEMESSMLLENICGMKSTTLTSLEIRGIKELKCLPDGLFSNNRNLSTLEIWYCPKMTHLVPLILRGGGAPASLRELWIRNCRSLRELPDDLHSLNSIETLWIEGCPDLKSIPYYPSSKGGQQQHIRGFTSLKELHIQNCAGLTNLPIEMLESCALSLETLTLDGSMISLTNVSEVIGCCLHKMTRLTFLNLYGVPKFSIGSASQHHDDLNTVSSLNALFMSPDPSWNNYVSFNETVDAMLPQLITSLRDLSLHGMEHWECLPDGLQHLTSLQELTLWSFGIEELPAELFGNLSSLESLALWDCKKLRHFPSKQAMQRLSKLKSLEINGCPLLFKEERSNNNPFERRQVVDSEWPKISHIPTIEVNGNTYSHHGH